MEKKIENISRACTEVLVILSYMEKIYIDMLPNKLLKFFYEKRDKNYNPDININKPLKEQSIERKTLVILAILNLQYWCKDAEDKNKLLKIYSENDKKL